MRQGPPALPGGSALDDTSNLGRHPSVVDREEGQIAAPYQNDSANVRCPPHVDAVIPPLRKALGESSLENRRQAK